jgi:hypothetical protein
MSKRNFKLTTIHLPFSKYLQNLGVVSNQPLEDIYDELGVTVNTFILNKTNDQKITSQASQSDVVKYQDTRFFKSLRKAKKCISRSIKMSKKFHKINKTPCVYIVNKENGLK